MKKSTKFYSALIAALLLTSGSFVSAAKAETLDQNQITGQLQQRLNLQPLTSQAGTNQTAATQVTYKHQIQANQAHEYVFKTNGGDFNVETLSLMSDQLDFLIYDLETEEVIDPLSTGSFNLPAGTYVFLVICTSEQTLNYEFQVNGPFSEQPDQTLPDFRINSPEGYDIQLPKGSNREFGFYANTNADQVLLNTDTEEIKVDVKPGYFTQYVTLRKGINSFIFTASKNSGNAITAYYSISLSGVLRLEGKDRYEVSSNISKELSTIGSSNNGTVIIARGDVFSDALSGGSLAAAEDAPILLTATQGLPDSVKEQIRQLEPKRAIILGGTGSVSTNVETQLKALGVTAIDRIGGKDRYAVAASVGDRVSGTMASDTAIIASGEVFPDALSASTIAGPMGMPILLVKSGEVPDSIQTYLKDHPEIGNFIVVGGPATVKDSVVSQIKSVHRGAVVERISGKDRYEVSINVAKYGIENFGMDLSTIAVARGDLFPDALSGAPLANSLMAPILLTSTSILEPKVNKFLSSYSGETQNIYILGGTGSVSQYTENQLDYLIK